METQEPRRAAKTEGGRHGRDPDTHNTADVHSSLHWHQLTCAHLCGHVAHPAGPGLLEVIRLTRLRLRNRQMTAQSRTGTSMRGAPACLCSGDSGQPEREALLTSLAFQQKGERNYPTHFPFTGMVREGPGPSPNPRPHPTTARWTPGPDSN